MARKLLIIGGLLAIALPRSAHAYLDPTSGSILLQVLLGGVAGAALALKLFWHRIQALFGSKSGPDDPAE